MNAPGVATVSNFRAALEALEPVTYWRIGRAYCPTCRVVRPCVADARVELVLCRCARRVFRRKGRMMSRALIRIVVLAIVLYVVELLARAAFHFNPL